MVGGAVAGGLLLLFLLWKVLSDVHDLALETNAAATTGPQRAPGVGDTLDGGLLEFRRALAQIGLPDVPGSLIAVVGISVGLCECFFGYRIFIFTLALTGFLIGAALGFAIVESQSHEPVVAVLAAILVGFVGAVLVVVLNFVGVFVLGALVGDILGIVLFAATQNNPQPVVLIAFAVVGGIAALLLRKFMVIMVTAFGGAWIVVAGVADFTAIPIDRTNIQNAFFPDDRHFLLIALGWLVLGVMGVVSQYSMIASAKPGLKTYSGAFRGP